MLHASGVGGWGQGESGPTRPADCVLDGGMCGIAGLLDLDARAAPDALGQRAQAMATALAHRGPDDAGVWVEAAAGVALAHRRLSIIDLSADGHQPMLSANGRWAMTYKAVVALYK